ncbi:hypothetical protein BY996DRAFT_6518160 [Phakopsora pachyrhizi]|nr:hypothetical protein BY996DRAFT_6518160 [Phakopsora pachyrhizi]
MLKHSSSLGGVSSKVSTEAGEEEIRRSSKAGTGISLRVVVATRAGVEGGIVNQGRVEHYRLLSQTIKLGTSKSQGEESSSNASPGYLLEQMSHLTWGYPTKAIDKAEYWNKEE